jgi:hypothetical protein
MNDFLTDLINELVAELSESRTVDDLVAALTW